MKPISRVFSRKWGTNQPSCSERERRKMPEPDSQTIEAAGRRRHPRSRPTAAWKPTTPISLARPSSSNPTLGWFDQSDPFKLTKPTCAVRPTPRSEEHTSELQSLRHLVCRLLLEKKKKKQHRDRV